MTVDRRKPDAVLPGSGSAGDSLSWLTLIAEAAREIHPDRSEELDQTADSITSSALTLIPGTTWAAITVVDRRRRSIRTLAATDDAPVTLNTVQQQAQAGPCLSVLSQEPIIRVDDLSAEDRWPDYSRAALELGVRAVLSLRLSVPDHSQAFGALSLYSAVPGGFDDDAVMVATAYATHAAIALDKSTLGKALDNRDVIGQAKGILIERYRLTADAAFDRLVETSQHTNRRLLDVAEHLVLTGDLPSR